MGQVSSALNHDGPGITVPDGYVTPSWPSLYIPTLSSTFDQEGIFLYEADAIWQFTFYWTLAMLGSIFLVSGLIAALNTALSLTVLRPKINLKTVPNSYSPPIPMANLPSSGQSQSSQPETSSSHAQTSTRPLKWTRRKVKRPPVWPVILIPIAMVIVAALVALVSATVVGFALAAVYSAGGFSVSTWVPLLWALIQVLVLIVSSYSTLTSIL